MKHLTAVQRKQLTKHLIMPEEIRKLYKQAAATVYNGIAADMPTLETESKKVIVEVIRDASHISTLGTQGLYPAEQRQVLRDWLKINEYNPAYKRDMDRAVREVI